MADNRVVLLQMLQRLHTALKEGGDDTKGAAFKVNIEAKWKETFVIRCNHVLLAAIPKYVELIVSEVQAVNCAAWWEHSSIARCFEYQRVNGNKHNAAHKKTVYFTFRLPAGLMAEMQDAWPEGTFRDLHLLVDWLK